MTESQSCSDRHHCSLSFFYGRKRLSNRFIFSLSKNGKTKISALNENLNNESWSRLYMWWNYLIINFLFVLFLLHWVRKNMRLLYQNQGRICCETIANVRFQVRMFFSVLRSLFGKKLPGKNNEGFHMKRLISASSLEKLVSSQRLVPLAGTSSLQMCLFFVPLQRRTLNIQQMPAYK